MLVGSDNPSTRIPYEFVQLLFVFSGSHCAPSEKQILVSKGKRTFDSKDQKFFILFLWFNHREHGLSRFCNDDILLNWCNHTNCSFWQLFVCLDVDQSCNEDSSKILGEGLLILDP